MSVKTAGAPELTVDREVPTHAAREISADRETESSPFGGPREIGAYLHERIEDALEARGRDADAGISHRDLYDMVRR